MNLLEVAAILTIIPDKPMLLVGIAFCMMTLGMAAAEFYWAAALMFCIALILFAHGLGIISLPFL